MAYNYNVIPSSPIRHALARSARACLLIASLLVLLPGAGCVMSPMGSFQDPRPAPVDEVGVGAGVVAMPLAFNGDGPSKGMFLGEFDLWLDFGRDQQRDIRLQFTLDGIWEDPDSRGSPSLLMAGATLEGKLANQDQTSALLIGSTFWVPFVDSSRFGDSMGDSGSDGDPPADYSPFYPWATLNVGVAHELLEAGGVRLLLNTRLNLIFILYMGATAHTALAFHIPLGDKVALRPEIFATCMALSTYMTKPSRFFLWSCGGGAALGLEF